MVALEKSGYLEHFARLGRGSQGGGPSWLKALRNGAIESFARQGFPTTRQEEWRFTNSAPIASIPFCPSGPLRKGALTVSDISRYTVCEARCTQLVFLNGAYCETLSTVKFPPKGVRIANLAGALESEPELIERYLARSVSPERNAFTALNTAFFSDGAFVYIPPGTIMQDPVHLLYLSTSTPDPAFSVPRSLIVLGEGSQASIVESYAGLDAGLYFTNSVTEVFVGPNCTADHYKLQRESGSAFHIAACHVTQDRDSRYASHSLSLGGALVRNDINIVLNGTGADCELNGLYVTKGRQHVDNHTEIDHARPQCTSRELYKGILDDMSTGVFNGRMRVRKDAQKTNAKQANRNLLLSKNAVINTTPQLEILADDVKCTHGATIGRLNEDELFYLRSRGIEEEAARTLLTYAFASELLAAVKIKPIQCQIDLVLLSRLSRTS